MTKESSPERPGRVRGPFVLLVLVALGVLVLGVVLVAATGGRAPTFHSPQVLPAGSAR